MVTRENSTKRGVGPFERKASLESIGCTSMKWSWWQSEGIEVEIRKRKRDQVFYYNLDQSGGFCFTWSKMRAT